jgi:hypothetical protein
MMSTTESEAPGVEAQPPETLGWEPSWLPDDATIHQRLIAILAELPAIGKDAYNPQQSFHYRSHDQVLNALNPLLAKHGVFVTPYVLKRTTAERKTGGGKAMYEVNLHVQYTFYGLAGDSIESSTWGEGTDMGDKATNKAMTMAFKNVIAQVFAISTEESYDTDGSSDEPTTGRVSDDRSRSQGQRGPAPTPGTPPAGAVLQGAIQGEGFQARLAEAFRGIDPTVDWTETMRPGVQHVFGVESKDEIPEERRPEYWRRVANAERKLRDLIPAGQFPPPEVDDARVLDVLQWAFDGAAIERLMLTEAAQAALDEAVAASMTEPTQEEEGASDAGTDEAARPGEEDPGAAAD